MKPVNSPTDSTLGPSPRRALSSQAFRNRTIARQCPRLRDAPGCPPSRSGIASPLPWPKENGTHRDTGPPASLTLGAWAGPPAAAAWPLAGSRKNKRFFQENASAKGKRWPGAQAGTYAQGHRAARSQSLRSSRGVAEPAWLAAGSKAVQSSTWDTTQIPGGGQPWLARL